jgi:hypothetical protein
MFAIAGARYELISGATARPKRMYSQMPSTRTTAIAPQTRSRENGTGSSGGWGCGFVIEVRRWRRWLEARFWTRSRDADDGAARFFDYR